MKKSIAKILVFLMAVTSVIVSVDFGFTESTESSESMASQETVGFQKDVESQPEDKEAQEIEKKSTDREQSSTESTQKKSSDEEQVVEDVEEEMDFLYIESKELEATGTQNIVVSWDEDMEKISEMFLVYENEKGSRLEIKESKRTDSSVLFTKDFKAGDGGTYTIKGVKYFVESNENFFEFDDVEIDATFKVIEKADTGVEEESVVTIDVDEEGVVDKKEVNNDMKAAAKAVNAVKSSKARSVKSGNVVVVLDPGHGGSDSGANGNGAKEADLNYKIATYCKAELEEYGGVTVYMTRAKNENPSLASRAKFAADKDADILVSLHNNSGSSSARGAEVYYPNNNYKPDVGSTGKNVAAAVQKELKALGLKDRGIKTRPTANGSEYPDGSPSDYYGIIRESKEHGIPAIIVEHAFISNKDDYKEFLNSDSKLKKLGVADATGIAKAFGLGKSGWEITDKGKKYRYSNGTYAKGYKKIGNSYYYFDEDGIMQIWSHKIDGKPYYFEKDGKGAKKGWINFKEGYKKYCLGGGKIETGYKKVGNSYYYFDEDGIMQIWSHKIDGKPYYFEKDGKGAKKGWINFKEGYKKYCLGGGKIETGYKKVGNSYYYFDEDGIMQIWSHKIDGKPYYFNGDGKGAAKGWINFKEGYIKYCLGNGELETGEETIDGVKYKFDEDGILKSPTGYVEIDNDYYYLNNDGIKQIWSHKIDGKPYYFEKDGKGAKKGWIKFKEGYIKYCLGGGKLATGEKTIDGVEYKFDEDGILELYGISGQSSVSVKQLKNLYNRKSGKYP